MGSFCMCFLGRMGSRTSRSRKFVSQSSELNGSSVASLSGDQSSLGLLQTMLGQVEAELDSLCPDREPASAQQRTQSLTGFSVALVSTMGRLVHLFKQVQLLIKYVYINHSYRQIKMYTATFMDILQEM